MPTHNNSSSHRTPVYALAVEDTDTKKKIREKVQRVCGKTTLHA